MRPLIHHGGEVMAMEGGPSEAPYSSWKGGHDHRRGAK